MPTIDFINVFPSELGRDNRHPLIYQPPSIPTPDSELDPNPSGSIFLILSDIAFGNQGNIKQFIFNYHTEINTMETQTVDRRLVLSSPHSFKGVSSNRFNITSIVQSAAKQSNITVDQHPELTITDIYEPPQTLNPTTANKIQLTSPPLRVVLGGQLQNLKYLPQSSFYTEVCDNSVLLSIEFSVDTPKNIVPSTGIQVNSYGSYAATFSYSANETTVEPIELPITNVEYINSRTLRYTVTDIRGLYNNAHIRTYGVISSYHNNTQYNIPYDLNITIMENTIVPPPPPIGSFEGDPIPGTFKVQFNSPIRLGDTYLSGGKVVYSPVALQLQGIGVYSTPIDDVLTADGKIIPDSNPPTNVLQPGLQMRRDADTNKVIYTLTFDAIESNAHVGIYAGVKYNASLVITDVFGFNGTSNTEQFDFVSDQFPNVPLNITASTETDLTSILSVKPTYNASNIIWDQVNQVDSDLIILKVPFSEFNSNMDSKFRSLLPGNQLKFYTSPNDYQVWVLKAVPISITDWEADDEWYEWDDGFYYEFTVRIELSAGTGRTNFAQDEDLQLDLLSSLNYINVSFEKASDMFGLGGDSTNNGSFDNETTLFEVYKKTWDDSQNLINDYQFYCNIVNNTTGLTGSTNTVIYKDVHDPSLDRETQQPVMIGYQYQYFIRAISDVPVGSPSLVMNGTDPSNPRANTVQLLGPRGYLDPFPENSNTTAMLGHMNSGNLCDPDDDNYLTANTTDPVVYYSDPTSVRLTNDTVHLDPYSDDGTSVIVTYNASLSFTLNGSTFVRYSLYYAQGAVVTSYTAPVDAIPNDPLVDPPAERYARFYINNLDPDQILHLNLTLSVNLPTGEEKTTGLYVTNAYVNGIFVPTVSTTRFQFSEYIPVPPKIGTTLSGYSTSITPFDDTTLTYTDNIFKTVWNYDSMLSANTAAGVPNVEGYNFYQVFEFEQKTISNDSRNNKFQVTGCGTNNIIVIPEGNFTRYHLVKDLNNLLNNTNLEYGDWDVTNLDDGAEGVPIEWSVSIVVNVENNSSLKFRIGYRPISISDVDKCLPVSIVTVSQSNNFDSSAVFGASGDLLIPAFDNNHSNLTTFPNIAWSDKLFLNVKLPAVANGGDGSVAARYENLYSINDISQNYDEGADKLADYLKGPPNMAYVTLTLTYDVQYQTLGKQQTIPFGYTDWKSNYVTTQLLTASSLPDIQDLKLRLPYSDDYEVSWTYNVLSLSVSTPTPQKFVIYVDGVQVDEVDLIEGNFYTWVGTSVLDKTVAHTVGVSVKGQYAYYVHLQDGYASGNVVVSSEDKYAGEESTPYPYVEFTPIEKENSGATTVGSIEYNYTDDTHTIMASETQSDPKYPVFDSITIKDIGSTTTTTGYVQIDILDDEDTSLFANLPTLPTVSIMEDQSATFILNDTIFFIPFSLCKFQFGKTYTIKVSETVNSVDYLLYLPYLPTDPTELTCDGVMTDPYVTTFVPTYLPYVKVVSINETLLTLNIYPNTSSTNPFTSATLFAVDLNNALNGFSCGTAFNALIDSDNTFPSSVKTAANVVILGGDDVMINSVNQGEDTIGIYYRVEIDMNLVVSDLFINIATSGDGAFLKYFDNLTIANTNYTAY